ncbi:MAG: hypothetical protein AAF587_30090 [Bacteroidota bacterium]
MFNKILIYVGIIGMLLISSCANPDLKPIITFEDAGKGAYVRLVKLTAGEYDLANIGSSSYEYEVEFVDLEQGATVTTFELFASFDDNNSGNGDDSKDQSLYKSFSAGDFATNGNGFVGLSISIPATDIINHFGLNIDNLKSGDIFEFESVLTTKSGAKHTGALSSPAVNGAAFGGYFDFDAKITCPLDDSEFSGSYTMEYVNDVSGGFGEPWGPQPEGGFIVELTTVAGSTTNRDFGVPDYLPNFGGFAGDPFRIDFACEFIFINTTSAGAGCGDGSITFAQDGDSAFNLDDDSSFTLNMVEFAHDGGCGVDPKPVILKFTKQ